VLQRHRFPAVVYAISDWVGGRMRWSRPQPGRAEPALMDAGALRAVHAAGITVGSHGASHVRLAGLGRERQRRELADSRAALEDLLGAEVRDLCYPFGSFDADSVALAGELGYRSAMTCLRGAATLADDALVLPRKAISFGDDLIGFGWKLLVKHAPKPALAAWRAHGAAAPRRP
jgi:peptidoglycan/xylan/chitin deacetylase (PgdA/CDA1 family)